MPGRQPLEQTDGRIEGEVPYRPFPQTPLPLWDKMAEDREGWRTARKICISGRFFSFSAAGREVQESEPAAGKNCSFYCKNYVAGVLAVRDSGSGRGKFPIRPSETWRPRRRPHSDPASDGGKFCWGSAPSAGQKAKAPVHGSARPSPLTEAGRLTKSICESLKDSANLM